MEYGRTHYLRIPKNKFWAWVGVSFAFGLAIGLAIMFARQAALSRELDAAKAQATASAQEASATIESMQQRLTSVEASLAAASEQIAAAQAEAAKQAEEQSTDQASNENTVTVVSRTISPSTVETEGAITMTAKVKGSPEKVTMRITGPNGYDEVFALKKSSTSDSTETWKAGTTAPKKAGTYKYYATAYKGDAKATMPGASPSTLKVE